MPVKPKLVLNNPVWIVYCITHTESGREYFGQTNSTLNLRWQGHVCGARRNANTRFLKAIKEYGHEAFTGVVLLEGLSQEEASGFEAMLIQSKHPDTLFNEYASGGKLLRAEDITARGAAISNSPAYQAHRIRLKEQWSDPEQRQKWLESRAHTTMNSSQAHQDNWNAKSEEDKQAQLDRIHTGRRAAAALRRSAS